MDKVSVNGGDTMQIRLIQVIQNQYIQKISIVSSE